MEKPKKKPFPERVNPPAATFSKKKVESSKKFEEMVSEGFKTFNVLAERQLATPTKESSAATISQNSAFAELIRMELDELPKEIQGKIRKDLLNFLESKKTEYMPE